MISGHTALPTAEMFNNLSEVEEGDVFYIHVLNQTLAYEVDQIKVVLPEDISDLLIDKNEDYVTLVTCTPYGINSHRLLVRGRDPLRGGAGKGAGAGERMGPDVERLSGSGSSRGDPSGPGGHPAQKEESGQTA